MRNRHQFAASKDGDLLEKMVRSYQRQTFRSMPQTGPNPFLVAVYAIIIVVYVHCLSPDSVALAGETSHVTFHAPD
ncbi:MAG TPA: hypothetical protein QGG30_03995 [Acidobacteriota bacterium]|nr:hypothetical protein [Acidobacteriota bacterium]MDP6687134.1 hypothetical protein [Acidobacteriota bacterium]MEC8943872.1 hypothetical protein [Acidobacteriota bacterium]HJO29630.1 hypothetical protein [Acidobacteriota bacterium]